MVDTPINPIDFASEELPQIDLGVKEPVEQVDLAGAQSNTISYQLPEGALPTRAFKAFYGLYNTPAAKTLPEFFQSLSLGQEALDREEASAKLNEAVSQKRQDAIAHALINGTPSTEDIAAISALHSNFYKPSSVFERSYADNYVQSLEQFAAKQDSDHFWNVAELAHPSSIKAAKDWGSLALAQRMVAETLKEENQAKIENSTVSGWGSMGDKYGSYLSSAADLAKILLIPGYTDYVMRGNIPNASIITGILQGENLEHNRQKLRELPFDQYTQALTNANSYLMSVNPHLAQAFLQAMIGQTSLDRFLNNITTAVDATVIATPFVKGAKAISGAMKASEIPEVAKSIEAVKDVIKSADALPSTENIVAATGDLKESAAIKATENLSNALKGASQSEREALEALPSHLRADRDKEKANPGVLNTTLANIIEQDSRAFEKNIMEALGTTLRPQSVPIESFSRKVIDDILKETADRYPGISNGMLKMTDPIYDPFSNKYEVNVWASRQGGILFKDEADAQRWAVQHGFSKDQVKQYPGQGLGYAIEMKGVKLDETGSVIRDAIVTPNRIESVSPSLRKDDDKLWSSRVFPIFDYARTPEDTFSAELRNVVKAGLSPQAVLRAVAAEEAELIRDLARGVKRYDELGNKYAVPRYFPGISGLVKKQKWNDFKRMLELAREDTDPRTLQKGYFQPTPEALQEKYIAFIGRLPTFEEQRAYFANKRLVEYDRMLRTVSMYRNKARVGAESYTIKSYENKPSEKPGIGHNQGPALDYTEVTSPAFDGVRRNYLPSKGNILVMGDDLPSSAVHSLDTMQPKLKRQIEMDVKSGKRALIEVFDPESRPFAGFADNAGRHVRYVLAKNYERNPLSWGDQVNRAGGGHFNYEYDHYIKQANVRQETIGSGKKATTTYRYEGDSTVVPVLSRAEGAHVSQSLNEIRLALKANDTAKADAIGATLPSDFYKNLKAGFYPSKDEKGVVHPPRLNFDEPFQVVPNRRAIIEMDNNLKRRYPENEWRDGTREGLMRNFQVEYTRERDAYDMFGPITMSKKGTKQNPIWNIEPGKMMDPIITANRALNRITQSVFMEDVKSAAVERWLAEAMPYLDVKGGPREVWGSPYHHFYNPEFLKGTPLDIKTPLMANRFKIRQLTGMPNNVEAYMYTMSQALYDAAYTKPKGGIGTAAHYAGRAISQIDPIWRINVLRDPVRVIKTLTFDMLMGLFSIPQAFVQQMQWVNISAVSPRSAPAAVSAMLFEQWSRFNNTPEIIRTYDNILTQLSKAFPGMRKWQPGMFEEAHRLLHQTGWHIVGGEHSMLDTNRVANFVKNGMDRFADWSRFFFREGERSPKIGSFYTAYLEYREANPTKKITQLELSKILDRADFLHGNMTVASHSVLHQGPVALMTQFFTYSIRFGEIMFSKRLAGGLGDTYAERQLTRGRLVLANLAMFGFPGAVGASMLPIGDWIRGKAIEMGYDYRDNAALTILMEGVPMWAYSKVTGEPPLNFGARFGQQGPTFIRDMVNADSNIYKIGAGASANVLFNTFGPNKEGLVDAFMHLAKGDFETYPPRWQDVIKAVSEVRSVSATEQLVTALRTGEWLNRNKDFVENVTAQQAWMRYLTGLRSQAEADRWPQTVIMRERAENERQALRRFREEMNLSLNAAASGNDGAKEAHFSRGVAILVAAGVDPDKIQNELGKIHELNNSIIDRTNFRFFIKPGPTQDNRERALKRFENIPQKGTR